MSLNGAGQKSDQLGMVPEQIAQWRRRRVARHFPAGVRQWACGGGLLHVILEPWGAWVHLRLTETVTGAKRFDGDGSRGRDMLGT